MEIEESKAGDLATKLSKLNVHNTYKKLKWRDEKIIELKEQVKDKQKLEHSLYTTGFRSYQCRLINGKNKYDSISQKCDSLQMFIKDLHEELELTRSSLCDSEDKYECMLERLQEIESKSFETKGH